MGAERRALGAWAVEGAEAAVLEPAISLPPTLLGGLSTVLAGTELVLLPQRALYWPAAATLVVADLHLGKADHFRRAGIALPRGGTSGDLQRLDALLAASGAQRLLVLGDFVHGDLAEAAWLQRWREWRQAHADVQIELVAGNHDRLLRAQPERAQTLGITLHTAALRQAPLVFAHAFEDATPQPAHAVLAGHVHPVLRLPGLPRLPVFAQRADRLLLPAFTEFAGGQALRRPDWQRCFVCTPQGVMEV